ncbi:hypothetical protein H4219_002374 [Mycoemilia scoparia]|uniref:Transcription factor Pcc1 n=1 Tax=Mycoemilia scoparia TaxID=417184 RepID=A0A9W8DU59_9FUNG|nr:hypothetical protein H4219_002374 [Mycoemilia scoparia]
MHSSSESECSDSDQQLSATHYDAKLPYTSDICLPFNSEKLASIAKNSIDADPEINPDRVHRYLSVENGDLIVNFECDSLKTLRVSINAFMDMVILVTQTMIHLDD